MEEITLKEIAGDAITKVFTSGDVIPETIHGYEAEEVETGVTMITTSSGMPVKVFKYRDAFYDLKEKEYGSNQVVFAHYRKRETTNFERPFRL